MEFPAEKFAPKNQGKRLPFLIDFRQSNGFLKHLISVI
jgi:hypothetical protein